MLCTLIVEFCAAPFAEIANDVEWLVFDRLKFNKYLGRHLLGIDNLPD
jgi:hypothetical protein